jgi:hypothetical protein
MRKICAACGLIALAGLAQGCGGTQGRNLVITEVGKKQVELFLNEPSGESLTLGGSYRLSVSTATGGSQSVNLGAFGGPLAGGTFLMVWEEGGYTGPPMAAPFSGGQQGPVPGIKVAADFFGDIDSVPSEIRLTGTRNRASNVIAIFPVFTTDQLDDVVRFGTPVANRPATGGSFAPDETLPNPTGSLSLQRRWGAGGPTDSNAEGDWTQSPTSWGVPTP